MTPCVCPHQSYMHHAHTGHCHQQTCHCENYEPDDGNTHGTLTVDHTADKYHGRYGTNNNWRTA